jgi:hypothetical protein
MIYTGKIAFWKPYPLKAESRQDQHVGILSDRAVVGFYFSKNGCLIIIWPHYNFPMVNVP